MVAMISNDSAFRQSLSRSQWNRVLAGMSFDIASYTAMGFSRRKVLDIVRAGYAADFEKAVNNGLLVSEFNQADLTDEYMESLALFNDVARLAAASPYDRATTMMEGVAHLLEAPTRPYNRVLRVLEEVFDRHTL